MADFLYFLILLLFIFSMILQVSVNSTFNRYSSVLSKRGYTGADVARMLLQLYGVNDVSVNSTLGNLTDHYSPNEKIIRLSERVYNSTSIAAIGVAAHETGHAIQHNRGYVPFNIRSAIFPLVSFSSRVYGPIFIVGIFLASFINSFVLAEVGIILFAFVVAFQIVTLPVELNASRRALAMLRANNFLDNDEVRGARSVLTVAALTYVAAAAMSLLQLLRFVAIVGGGRRRRD